MIEREDRVVTEANGKPFNISRSRCTKFVPIVLGSSAAIVMLL
jgi:hypothetical protein